MDALRGDVSDAIDEWSWDRIVEYEAERARKASVAEDESRIEPNEASDDDVQERASAAESKKSYDYSKPFSEQIDDFKKGFSLKMTRLLCVGRRMFSEKSDFTLCR